MFAVNVIISLFLCFFYSYACGQAFIRGTLRDNDLNSPINTGKLVLTPLDDKKGKKVEVMPDDDGVFIFYNLSQGRYNLEYVGGGYIGQRIEDMYVRHKGEILVHLRLKESHSVQPVEIIKRYSNQYNSKITSKPKQKIEIGAGFGSSVFLGDLGGGSGVGKNFSSDADKEAFRLSYSLFARWEISPYLHLKWANSYLCLAGSDKWAGHKGQQFNLLDLSQGDADAAWYRRYRNLSFRSRVWESSLLAELCPLKVDLESTGERSYLLPYLSTGIGLFHFNPQTFYQNRWVCLKPLSTEGQGILPDKKPYHLLQVCIPVALGFRWVYEHEWSVGVEINHRITFTDYIDDVSGFYVDPQIFYEKFSDEKAQLAANLACRSTEIDPQGLHSFISSPEQTRGQPKNNDSYYTINAQFTYYLQSRYQPFAAPQQKW